MHPVYRVLSCLGVASILLGLHPACTERQGSRDPARLGPRMRPAR
jgi:hypothetical protein